jgi:transposase
MRSANGLTASRLPARLTSYAFHTWLASKNWGAADLGRVVRAIATRYDKTARNFLAAIHLAAAIIWLN